MAGACCVAALATTPTGAQPAAPLTTKPVPRAAAAPPSRPPAASNKGEDGARWQSLSAAQREALAPLEREWPSLDGIRRQKWIAIADRFRSLPPAERARITTRMTEWAQLTPAQRGEVRLRFQESRQVGSNDRGARWEAYQRLTPEEREAFAARGGVAPGTQQSPARRRDPGSAKTNVVPNPALVQPARPIAPTIIQATPGATTRPITRLPTPPAHQHTGMPKVATTPEFVNRSTLLPRRGPQAAAVAAPAPATSTPSRPPGPIPAR